MAHRISKQTIEARIQTINQLAGTPVAAYSLNEVSNRYKANVGNYHADAYAPGDRNGTRYSLVQMVNEGGGVRTIIPTVLGAANFLDTLNAFLMGLELGKRTTGEQVEVAA